MFRPDLPAGLPAIAEKFLQAVFMDGLQRGLVMGFIAGAVVALIVVGVWQNRQPPR